MHVVAPQRPPRPDDREALIEEARRRQRLRRRRVVIAATTAGIVGIGAYVAASGRLAIHSHHASRRPVAEARRCPGVDLGTVAFVRGGALATVDFRHCKTRVIVPSHVNGPVQFSADGRYVSFNGGYVRTSGGVVQRTAGSPVWSPRGELFATGKGRSGVQLVSAGHRARTVLPDGWGATTFVFSPDGRTLAVSRSLYSQPGVAPPYHQEIWLVDVVTGRRKLIFRQPRRALAPPWLAGYSRDGRWLVFWEDTQNSASIAADGLPLLAIRATGGRPVEISSELHYRDYVAWCGRSLVFVLNHGGRDVRFGDGIGVASPPAWKPKTILAAGGRLSWTSLACSPLGARLAIAAGASDHNDLARFGHEHRSIWLASVAGGAKARRLVGTPPPGQTDELPMWSRDGRWVVFVRTARGGVQKGWLVSNGSLYAVRVSSGRLIGPIAMIGATGNYYGAYGWPDQLDWHR